MTLSLPGLRIAGRQGGAIRRARRAESVEDLLQPGLPAIALAVAAAVMAALLVAAVVAVAGLRRCLWRHGRSEEHTSELQSLMRISYAVFCLKKKNTKINYEAFYPIHTHEHK